MNKQKIILVHGKKRSGKDYFSNLLKSELENRNFKVSKFAFADAFKKILCTTLKLNIDQLNELKNNKAYLYIKDKENNFIPITDFRSLHQNFGDDAMKSVFGKTVWHDIVNNLIWIDDCSFNRSDFIIVSDFRVYEEYIQSSIAVKIKNDDTDIQNTDIHRTENGLTDFNFDYIIDNTGYIDLKEQIDKFISEFLQIV